MLPTIEHVQGDDFLYDIVVEKDGARLDVTGWRFWLTVKTSIEDADSAALLALSTDDETIAGSDPVHGVATAEQAQALTDTPAGRYYLDVQSRDSAGKLQTKLRGYLLVLPQGTSATP